MFQDTSLVVLDDPSLVQEYTMDGSPGLLEFLVWFTWIIRLRFLNNQSLVLVNQIHAIEECQFPLNKKGIESAC